MKIRLLILFFSLLSCSAFAAELKGSCEIDFTGTSTLHDFTGTAVCAPFTFSYSADQPPHFKLDGEQVEVPVTGMDTDNNKRDIKMRTMFDAELFPYISGRLDEPADEVIRKLAAAQNSTPVPLALHLKIRDIDLLQTAQITSIHEDERQLEIELETELSLEAYQLEPPGFLGLIRVGDLVKVKIHLLLAKIGKVPKQILN